MYPIQRRRRARGVTAAAGGGPVEFVQSNADDNDGPITLTGATAGNALVAIFTSGYDTMASTALPAGWQKLTPVFAGGIAQCMWVYPNWGGGNVSATITSPPASGGSWAIHEYSGVDTSTPVEDHDTTSASSSSWTAPAVTVSSGGGIAVAAGRWSSGDTMTITTSGFVQRTWIWPTPITGSADNMAAGSHSAGGYSSGGTDTWVSTIVSLKPA